MLIHFLLFVGSYFPVFNVEGDSYSYYLFTLVVVGLQGIGQGSRKVNY